MEEAIDDVSVVSFDVFNTLVVQARNFDQLTRNVVAESAANRLKLSGTDSSLSASQVGQELSRLRSILMRAQIGGRQRAEIPRLELYRAFYSKFFDAAQVDQSALALMQLEERLHALMTCRSDQARQWIEFAHRRGKRVIAISDSYLDERQIQSLLSCHGVSGIEKVYSSCEWQVDKFHGQLFDKVLESEGISAGNLVHIGDSLLADVFSASEKGVRTVWYRPSNGRQNSITALPNDPCVQVGYGSLGPIFADVCHRLVLEVLRNDIQYLAFVARDGALLQQAMARFLSVGCLSDCFVVKYLFLSRRSTALASFKAIGENEVREALRVRAGGSPAERIVNYFNLADVFPKSRLAELNEGNFECFSDPEISGLVAAKAVDANKLLLSYLAAEGLLSQRKVGLIDVGWRGSIQASLQRAIASDEHQPLLHGVYIGLWDPWSGESKVTNQAVGLVSDQSRGRNLLESSAWHLSSVLEAVSRARHGTVLGYTRTDDGAVAPLLSDDGEGFQAENSCDDAAQRIRRGILEYIDQHVSQRYRFAEGFATSRIRAQCRILRLAFFPTRQELSVFGGLVHTEGHSKDWVRPLVIRHPMARVSYWWESWLSGLQSPWRGGYVAATGGCVASMMYLLIEALFAKFPRLNRCVQNAVRSVVRVTTR